MFTKLANYIVDRSLGHSARSMAMGAMILGAAVLGSATSAKASILMDYGYNDQGWLLFSLGGTLKINNGDVDGDIAAYYKAAVQIIGTSEISGDAYIDSINGKYVMSDEAVLEGTLYTDAVSKITVKNDATLDGGVTSPFASNGLAVELKKMSQIEDGISNDTSSINAKLDALRAQAKTASNNAKALTATRSVSSVNLSGGSGGASGGLGETVVLKLSDFKLDRSTFTLTGTTTTKFVINVSNNFEMKGDSKLLLSGGLLAENVLFNVVNGGGATIEKSVFNGILLAVDRSVKVTKNSTLAAEILANSIEFTDSAIDAVSQP